MPKTMLPRTCVLALLCCLGTAAHGQVPSNRGPTQTVPTQPSVNLTMEHKHILKENLLKDAKVRPEVLQSKPEAGKVVPTAVLLHAIPEAIASRVPAVRAYNFFVTDDAIVLVQPGDRKIVEVIRG
jgi:hypothetical protein